MFCVDVFPLYIPFIVYHYTCIACSVYYMTMILIAFFSLEKISLHFSVLPSTGNVVVDVAIDCVRHDMVLASS